MLRLTSIFAVCVLAYFASGQQDPPPVVDELKLDKYLGAWYQAYANIIVIEGQNLGDSLCVTAEYDICNATAITVLNRQCLESPDPLYCQEYNISGIGYLTEEVGKISVYFPSVSPPPTEETEANYWVMKLGPETYGEEGLYQYSLVTNGPSRTFNYVLARDVEYFNANYYDEVFEFLENNGFNTTLTELLPSFQGEPCEYPLGREPELPDDVYCPGA